MQDKVLNDDERIQFAMTVIGSRVNAMLPKDSKFVLVMDVCNNGKVDIISNSTKEEAIAMVKRAVEQALNGTMEEVDGRTIPSTNLNIKW